MKPPVNPVKRFLTTAVLAALVIGYLPGRAVRAKQAATLPTRIVIGSTPADITLNEVQQSVTGIADFNGDGADDILLETFVLTVPIFQPAEADIIFGKKGAVSPAGIQTAGSSPDVAIKFDPGSRFGRITLVSAVSDINNDLIGDILLAADQATGPGGKKGSAIFALTGSKDLKGSLSLSGVPPYLTVFEESSPIPQPVDEGGSGVVLLAPLGVADVNGDGAADLIFSETRSGLMSSLSILLGPFSAGQVIDLGSKRPDIVITGSNGGGPLTEAHAADVNGDGIDDLLISRPFAGRHGDGSGELDVVFGSRNLKSGVQISLDAGQYDAAILGAVGSSPGRYGDELGRVVATGDFNGDGVDDIVLGVPDHGEVNPSNSNFTGELYVVFGSPALGGRLVDIALGQQDVTVRGASPGDDLGYAISSGDVDGDGIDDIVALAPGAQPKIDPSTASIGPTYIMLGSGSLKRGSVIDIGKNQQDVTVLRPALLRQLRSFTAFGDFNGDGVSDLLFDLPGEASLTATALVYFGAPIRPPVITRVKFKKAAARLFILGTDFTGSVQIVVNGVPLNRDFTFTPETGELLVGGAKRELNLHSGVNTIVVKRKQTASNTFVLTL